MPKLITPETTAEANRLTDQRMAEIDFSGIPGHCREGLRAYIRNGHSVGGFLTALLSNDLMRAFGSADSTNREAMLNYVQFLHNQAPAGCYGSPQKVADWIEGQGLYGLYLPDAVETAA